MINFYTNKLATHVKSAKSEAQYVHKQMAIK